MQPFIDWAKKNTCRFVSWKQHNFFVFLCNKLHKSNLDTTMVSKDGIVIFTVYGDSDHQNTDNFMVVEISQHGTQFGTMNVLLGNGFSA